MRDRLRYAVLSLMPRRFRHRFPRWYWTQGELDAAAEEAKRMGEWFRSMDRDRSKEDR